MSLRKDRPIRIAGASGAVSDRRDAFRELAQNYVNDPVDVIIGDWMSEVNMTVAAGRKKDRASSQDRANSPDFLSPTAGVAYEPTFLEALEPALSNIAKYGIKVAVNAGGSDTKMLFGVVNKMISDKGLQLKVAWIEGDEVLEAVNRARTSKEIKFENICTGEVLDDWKFEPIYAQCYLGGLGIAAAFEKEADIVLCGRVSDASPVIGAAYWWHGWTRSDLDRLANAFVAGHLIECSNYVCGGNYTGFKTLEGKGWDNIGYPIAEISATGQVIITKQKSSGGEVSVGTCSSQLLYEIQGPWYFNSDVTAVLNSIWFQQLSSDRVALCGVQSAPPPPTTKVGITAKGGYQAEMHWFLVGLDIASKARMLEAQVRRALKAHSDRFTVFTFTRNGSCPDDPIDQNSATVDFRIFAQAPTEEDLSPLKFFRPIADLIMQGYPGATFHLDYRQALPKPVFEYVSPPSPPSSTCTIPTANPKLNPSLTPTNTYPYRNRYFVTLLPQSHIHHTVHPPTGAPILIPPPAHSSTRLYPSQQPSQPYTLDPTDPASFGPTVRGPLGWIAHARSGDKGSNANVGFWVHHRDEWDWLRGLLSVDAVTRLLGNEYRGGKIDRFELPNLFGVHFLLHDHLDRGVSCSSTYDFLGKNAAEFLRARWVDLPRRFLDRGKL